MTVAEMVTLVCPAPPSSAPAAGLWSVTTGPMVSTKNVRATTVVFASESVAVAVQTKLPLSEVGRSQERVHVPLDTVVVRAPTPSAQSTSTPERPEPSLTEPLTTWVLGFPSRSIEAGAVKVSAGPCVSTSTCTVACVTLFRASCARSVTIRATRSRFGGNETVALQVPFG
ncbi:MAG: hypothetical protein IAE78_00590 [Myxococcus sp.]|nr:hypothetical protein [Myxococcus sp.]